MSQLQKDAEITREVKEEENQVKDATKDAVKGAAEGVKDLAKKTADMSIDEAPEKLLPSSEKIDQKLAEAQHNLEKARTAQHGDASLADKPKIQQVISDTQNIIQDNRDLLKSRTENDDTLKDTVQHAANLAQALYDQSNISLDKLWSNWVALLTVVGAGGAGSWKGMLEEGGKLINDLRHTQDFVKLLTDLQNLFYSLVNTATKNQNPNQKINEMSQELQQQRDKLMADFKGCFEVLSKSPMWQQLVAQGKAMKTQLDKVADQTKEQIKDSASEVEGDAQKLKEDLKNVLQLAVGKDGPSVEPFLDYAAGAWNDIVGNDAYSRYADELNSLFEVVSASPDKMNEEAYQKQYEDLFNKTKDLLDNTVQNENLTMAMRESKKLIKSAKKDPATKKLIQDASKLMKHVSDNKGANLLDPQLLEEIRSMIVPIVVDHFNNAPLPDYHGKDSNALGKYEYTLSGIRVGTTGLIPSKVKIEFRYKAIANPSKLEVSEQKMYMYMEVEDIQVSFKDVKWHYDRLSIPKFSDEGTVDLGTTGKGISFKLKAEIKNYEAPKTSSTLGELLSEPKEQKMFDILKVECNIDGIEVHVSDAGAANVFYKMLAGLMATKVKHQIEHQVERKLNILAERFDRQLYDLVRRATAPSLTSELQSTLLAGGEALKEKAGELKNDAAASMKSMM